MKASIGRIVHYVLKLQDAETLNLRRQGNYVTQGEHVAMLITKVWPNEFGEGVDGVNGTAFLDGPGTLWVTSVPEGAKEGTWHEPERV